MGNKQIEEFIKHYDKLRKNKDIVANIDKDFFFKFADETIEYIKQLECKVKRLGKGQQNLMQSRRKWKNRYYKQKQKQKKIRYIINNLKSKYEQLTQSVKRYEEMRRSCRVDSFYKKSYQTSIHRLNAKRETISNIIEMLEACNDN